MAEGDPNSIRPKEAKDEEQRLRDLLKRKAQERRAKSHDEKNQESTFKESKNLKPRSDQSGGKKRVISEVDGEPKRNDDKMSNDNHVRDDKRGDIDKPGRRARRGRNRRRRRNRQARQSVTHSGLPPVLDNRYYGQEFRDFRGGGGGYPYGSRGGSYGPESGRWERSGPLPPAAHGHYHRDTGGYGHGRRNDYGRDDEYWRGHPYPHRNDRGGGGRGYDGRHGTGGGRGEERGGGAARGRSRSRSRSSSHSVSRSGSSRSTRSSSYGSSRSRSSSFSRRSSRSNSGSRSRSISLDRSRSRNRSRSRSRSGSEKSRSVSPQPATFEGNPKSPTEIELKRESRSRSRSGSVSKNGRHSSSPSRSSSRNGRDESKNKKDRARSKSQETDSKVDRKASRKHRDDRRSHSSDSQKANGKREDDALTKDQRTVFVSQLVMRADERDIRRYFCKKAGCKVNDVILLRDRRTGRHKGCAYVELGRLDDVPRAVKVSSEIPDFQRFPILVKASEAEKNYSDPSALGAIVAGTVTTDAANRAIAAAFPGTILGGKRVEAQKVYVGSIDRNVTQAQLFAIFSQFGQLDKVLLQIDTATGLSRGFAFLSYPDPKAANLAIQTMSGQMLAGRPIEKEITVRTKV